MSLVNELGINYVNDFFHGTMVQKDGYAYVISNVGRNGISASRLNLSAVRPEWDMINLPLEFLNSFKDLEWPRLGYRNIKMRHSDAAPVVYYVSCTRAVQRGIALERLTYAPLPIFTSLNRASNPNNALAAQQVYRPLFVSLKEGMQGILEGRMAGFAVNADIAVAVSISTRDAVADVFYRNKLVGHIDRYNRISLNNKTLSRSKLKLLQQEIYHG